MNERKPIHSDPWQYTMSASETQHWTAADAQERRMLLTALAERVMCQAADHGHNRFVIYDINGELVAKGRLQPGNIEDELESFRAQNRRN